MYLHMYLLAEWSRAQLPEITGLHPADFASSFHENAHKVVSEVLAETGDGASSFVVNPTSDVAIGISADHHRVAVLERDLVVLFYGNDGAELVGNQVDIREHSANPLHAESFHSMRIHINDTTLL